MRRYLLFCALGALFGCRSVSEPSGTAIALFCSTSEQSKTDILTQGDEIGVFSSIEGTEQYFLDNVKFVVGSDGRSLNYGSTVYYPDPKQAVRFFAYFPFGGTWDKGRGTFSVPVDQSTAGDLKAADLCGATASTTPVTTPISLEFNHLLARVVITTNEPTTRIIFPNTVASGVLHAATAEFVLGSNKTDISTTGNELIVPVQPLTRLVLTVSGVEYVFDTAPIALQAGQTTTLNLTLHPNTKTATLSGSSVTDWELVKTEGNPTHAVSNTLTLHWSNHLLQGTAPDQVVFTINETNYTVSRGISHANQTVTVPFAFEALRYPYTLTKIDFYLSGRLVQSCNNLLGGAIVKSGACVVGLRQGPTVPNPPKAEDYVEINGLYWAKGNLVAVNQSNAKVGKPEDGGLYFQFGSLIGYKGGALANGGSGVGSNPYTSAGTQWWGGATAYSWANDAMVWPTGMAATPATWPQNATTNQWYFGLQEGWNTAGQNIRDFLNLATGGLANVGVGDPCTYYLGGNWRQPTTYELASITGITGSSWVLWKDANGSWTTLPVAGANLAGSQLFFPASGFRTSSNGTFLNVSQSSYEWSSSLGPSMHGYSLNASPLDGVIPQGIGGRSLAFPVRCVAPASHKPNPPTADDYVTINGLKWAKGNLVALAQHQAKVGKPADGGLYFQFGSLIGYKGGNQANGGNGVGTPQAPLTTSGTYWNGSGYSWASDAMVWPSELVGTKATWTNTIGSNIITLSDYYFNYSSGWETSGQDIRSFAVSISGDSGTGTLATGRYAKKGVGDPCSYYLGGAWRLPTGAEYAAMCNNKTTINTNYSWGDAGGSWVPSSVIGGNLQGTKLFFPASGYRYYSGGSFNSVTSYGGGWSSSVYSVTTGLQLHFNGTWVYPQYYHYRSYGFPVRCVSN